MVKAFRVRFLICTLWLDTNRNIFFNDSRYFSKTNICLHSLFCEPESTLSIKKMSLCLLHKSLHWQFIQFSSLFLIPALPVSNVMIGMKFFFTLPHYHSHLFYIQRCCHIYDLLFSHLICKHQRFTGIHCIVFIKIQHQLSINFMQLLKLVLPDMILTFFSSHVIPLSTNLKVKIVLYFIIKEPKAMLRLLLLVIQTGIISSEINFKFTNTKIVFF